MSLTKNKILLSKRTNKTEYKAWIVISMLEQSRVESDNLVQPTGRSI